MSAAEIWVRRAGRFLLTVLALCALGAALGATLFPIVGKLGGTHKPVLELVVRGARTGGFFFLVWAPGLALVREFMRAAREKQRAG
jgi:hypothetical protein